MVIPVFKLLVKKSRGFLIRQALNEGPLALGRIALAWSFRMEISVLSVVCPAVV